MTAFNKKYQPDVLMVPPDLWYIGHYLSIRT